MNNKLTKKTTNEKIAERYAVFYQKLLKAYDKKEISLLKEKSSFFDSLEKKASSFTPDKLEAELIKFIEEKHDFYAEIRTKRVVLFQESIKYDNYNPYKLIQTAFRGYIPDLTWINFVLRKLEKMPYTDKDLFTGLFTFCSLVLSIIIYVVWVVLACQGSVCLFGSEIDLFFYFITACCSLIIGAIAFILIIVLMFIFSAFFETINIINRCEIKLPESRLLFAELESIKLMPMIVIEINEKYKEIDIALTIELNDKLIAKIAQS